jgi:PIN domain nuclease of toxin-antitoxin system
MKFIIDTQIFLWAAVNPEKLTSSQMDMLQTRTNTVYVSSISIAEIMMKNSLGKPAISFDPLEAAKTIGFELLDYRGQDALLLKDLPYYHNDPFDRMIITQSLAHDIPVMTIDTKFKQYGCKLITGGIHALPEDQL